MVGPVWVNQHRSMVAQRLVHALHCRDDHHCTLLLCQSHQIVQLTLRQDGLQSGESLQAAFPRIAQGPLGLLGNGPQPGTLYRLVAGNYRSGRVDADAVQALVLVAR